MRTCKRAAGILFAMAFLLAGLLNTQTAEAATVFYQSGLYYKVTSTADQTASVYRSEGANETLVIPQTISRDGVTYTVTAFEDNAFQYDTRVKEITIPETISVVSNAGFSNCRNLEKAMLYSKDITYMDFPYYTEIFCYYYSQTELTAEMYGYDVDYLGVVFDDPHSLTATPVSGSEIRLEWEGDVGPGYYEIYRSTSENGTYELVGTSYPCVFTDSWLTKDTTYYYKVCKTEQPGSTLFRSEFTNVASATTTSVYPDPDVTELEGSVQNVQATAIGDGTIKLTWDSFDGATAYFIFSSDEPMSSKDDGYVLSVVSATDDLVYYDEGNLAGDEYYYIVVAAQMQQNHTYVFSDDSQCVSAVVQ